MSGKASAVLWLGLLLIALNLISRWGDIKSVIFKGASGGSGGGGFTLPTLPLPFPFNVIPTAQTAPPASGTTPTPGGIQVV